MSVKKQIETALTELEGLYKSEDRSQKRLEKDLAPFQEKLDTAMQIFDESTAEIRAKDAEKRSATQSRIGALRKEIEGAMLTNADADGAPKLKLVVGAKLAASARVTRTVRDVSAKTFIAKFKDGWDCLKVTLGAADKQFGAAEVDKIADSKEYWGVDIKEV